MKFDKLLATTLGASIALLSISDSAFALAASVKATGMAAVGVAYPQDALAAAFNPAGAVEICDRVDSGITWLRDRGHARIKGNILDDIPPIHALLGANVNGRFNGFKTRDFYSPDFGINKRLGCDNQWAVGLVCYNRNFQKTTYNKPFVLFGTSNAGLEYVHQTVSAVIAYKINECHNLGLNINLNVERIKVNGLEKLTFPERPFPPIRSLYPDKVTNKGYDYAHGWGATLGWQWHVIENVTIGLTYQPKCKMSRLKKYKGFLAHKGELDIPAMYSGGIAWAITPCSTIAFDVQHYAWDQIQALHNPLLHKGVLELLGSKHGPGFGFRSQTFYRLGVDYALNDCWTVRAGYRYGNTPIRKSQTAVNQFTLDCVEQFVTCGVSWMFNECNEISSMFAWGFEKTIKGKNSIPPGIPPAGFGGGNADLTEQKFAFGLSWGWYY